MKKLITTLGFGLLMATQVNATITKELINFNNQDQFLLLKFSRGSISTYRSLSRAMVATGLRENVGACKEESVIVDRFGRRERRQICTLSLQASKSFNDNVERLQFIDLGEFLTDDQRAALHEELSDRVGKKNPVILNAGLISTRGARSCTVTNANPSCSTRQIPAVVADQAFEERPALQDKNKRIICTFNSEQNPPRFYETETCLVNLSNEVDLNEEELIARYPRGTKVVLLEEVKCSTKTKRHVGGTRNNYLYPNRIQTFISNIGSFSFEHGFNREFFNVKFTNEVEDLGVFCEVTDVKDLERKMAMSRPAIRMSLLAIQVVWKDALPLDDWRPLMPEAATFL